MKKFPKACFPCFLLVLSFFSMEAYAKPGFLKVVLERDDHQTGGPPEEVLARLEARLVKSYPAFSVVRVPEARRHEIENVAHGAGWQARVQEDWDLVQMPGYIVDTRAPRLPGHGVLSGYPGGEGLYVLQFEAPLDADWTAEIEKAGLRYVTYLPTNAVLVYGSQSAVAVPRPCLRSSGRPCITRRFGRSRPISVRVTGSSGTWSSSSTCRAARWWSRSSSARASPRGRWPPTVPTST